MRFSPTKLLHGLLYTAPVLLITLAACGGGGGGSTPPAPVIPTYTIGGTIVSVDASSVVLATSGIGPILQNNGGDNLFIPAIGPTPTAFTFSTPVADGAAYLVTQLSRARAPTQICAASGVSGAGTVAGANITTVEITCSVSPVADPKFAYVTNNTANTVSAYTINPTSGVLTAAAPSPTAPTGDGPYSVTVDPSGQFAYVANSNTATVSAYSIDSGTGELTALASIATGAFPISVTVHPSGKFAYTVNQGVGPTGNTISAYSINTATGALSAMDADGATADTQATIATGTLPYAITVDPTGQFAYVANNTSNDVSAYTINQTTGALTVVTGSPFAAGTNPRSIAIDPTGKYAFVANAGGDVSAYSIDAVTVPGKLTQINCVSNGISTCSGINYTAGSAPRSIFVDPSAGLYAYVANAGGGVSAFAVDPATGELSAIDADAEIGGDNLTIAAGTAPISVNVDPSGQFVYVANFGTITPVATDGSVSVYSIGAGGALTLVETAPTVVGTTISSITTTQ